MAKRTTTMAQKIAINDALRERLEIIEPGVVRYKDPDDSDDKIAQELDVSNKSVAYIRLEMFGKFVGTRSSGNPHHEVELRFNMLIDKLRAAGIGDIEHLKFNRQ